MTTSRRSLMRGVAWATPMAAVSMAAPAFAASSAITVTGCGSATLNVPLVPEPTDESPDPQPGEVEADANFTFDAPVVTNMNGGAYEVSSLTAQFLVPLIDGFLIPDAFPSSSEAWGDLKRSGTSTINGAPAAVYTATYTGAYSIDGIVATAQPGDWSARWNQMQLPRESLPDGQMLGEAYLIAASTSGARAESDACGEVVVRPLPIRG